jgi:hypothetical protein
MPARRHTRKTDCLRIKCLFMGTRTSDENNGRSDSCGSGNLATRIKVKLSAAWLVEQCVSLHPEPVFAGFGMSD